MEKSAFGREDVEVGVGGVGAVADKEIASGGLNVDAVGVRQRGPEILQDWLGLKGVEV